MITGHIPLTLKQPVYFTSIIANKRLRRNKNVAIVCASFLADDPVNRYVNCFSRKVLVAYSLLCRDTTDTTIVKLRMNLKQIISNHFKQKRNND